VENRAVTFAESWLIRPPIFEFAPFNVALHGIGPDQCRDAPDWPTSLATILSIADGRPMVAHNASFDIGVIRDASDVCALPWPELTYACTLVLSRRRWPELSSYSLPFVAGHLGVEVGTHHDPAADAVAAAQIGMHVLGDEPTWLRVADAMRVHLGRVTADSWSGCHSKDLRYSPPTQPSEGIEVDPNHPLFGKTVVFTGELAVRRRDAQQAAVNVGAVAGKGVTRSTDFLVTGYQDLSRLARGESKSAKFRKAESCEQRLNTGPPATA